MSMIIIIIALLLLLCCWLIAHNLVKNGLIVKNIKKYPVDKSIEINKYGIDPNDQHFFETHKAEKISIVIDGLNLTALCFDQGSHNWAICIHGYTGDAFTMGRQASHYYEKCGFNVLCVNLRGARPSGGEYICMGGIEDHDIKGWIDWIVHNDFQSKIILHGESMGAATVLHTIAGPIDDHVICAISDSSYTSASDELGYLLKVMYKLPKHPILDFSVLYFKTISKIDLNKIRPIAFVKTSMTPTMFIHGKADTFVPFSMYKQLFEAANCEKESLVIKDAGHIRSNIVDNRLYWNTVDNFIKKHLDQTNSRL